MFPINIWLLITFVSVLKIEVSSSGKNNSRWWVWGNILLPSTDVVICKSERFAIWRSEVQTLQAQKGLENTALSSRVQSSLTFKLVWSGKLLKQSKWGENGVSTFHIGTILIKFFIQSILIFNIISYEMQEEGQSPADILGGRKISFKTLGYLFDVKRALDRAFGNHTKEQGKGI